MFRHTVCLLFSAMLLLGGCNYTYGSLSLTLTDAPVDNATSVVVTVAGVKATPTTGNAITYTFPQPQQIDLLQLQNGLRTPLISGWSLPVGSYKSLVLVIDNNATTTDTYVILNDGSQHILSSPSGSPSCASTCSYQTYLTINTPFTVGASTDSSYVIDFDARKSVLPPAASSTDYRLQPLGRMIAETSAGNILGTVSGTLITAGCAPAVYVFAGIDGNPGDINNTASVDTQPVTESAVTLDNGTGQYGFTAAYLPAGQYTVAFTCQADQDNPAAADNIVFTFTGSLWVSAGQTSKVSLN
jgi:hypothetical protein